MRGHFGDAVCPRGMRTGGDDSFAPGLLDHLGHFVRFGGDHNAIREGQRLHALKDANNEGRSTQETQWLAGEPCGPESSGDDG